VHHHDETSSEEEIVEMESHSQPLKPQKRGAELSMLHVLQDEIKQLQRNNEDKDRMIRELKYELDGRAKKAQLEEMLARQTNSISKSKKDLLSPKGMISRVYSPEVKAKSKGYLPAESDYALQIALLEKQIKEFQLKVMQLTSKLSEYE
jgi:hypothetical protein